MDAVIYKFEILDSGSQHIYIRGKQTLLNAIGPSLYTII